MGSYYRSIFWDWLSFDESGGTTIRNVGLITAAVTALPLAIWRGLVAERLADAAHQSLRNERYQKGAEMLGNEVLSVRLGGIYALRRLVEDHPNEYHIQIIELLCAFARHPTRDYDHETQLRARWGIPRVRDDVKVAIQTVGKVHRPWNPSESTEASNLDF